MRDHWTSWRVCTGSWNENYTAQNCLQKSLSKSFLPYMFKWIKFWRWLARINSNGYLPVKFICLKDSMALLIHFYLISVAHLFSVVSSFSSLSSLFIISFISLKFQFTKAFKTNSRLKPSSIIGMITYPLPTTFGGSDCGGINRVLCGASLYRSFIITTPALSCNLCFSFSMVM